MIVRRTSASADATQGRLTARPGAPSEGGPVGLQRLGLDGRRDGRLYVPTGYQPDQELPLVVMLHGAGGSAQHSFGPLMSLAYAAGIILLAPDSRAQSWDVLYGGFGPDIEFIDRALDLAFRRYAVDPARVAIGGFSDGASYALSVGLTNGDLFTHIVAFSPGFVAPGREVGAPRIYVSHGTRDAVLRIDACSRRIVPALQRAGYDVTYHEFDGPHTVPPEIALEAVEWLSEGTGTGHPLGGEQGTGADIA